MRINSLIPVFTFLLLLSCKKEKILPNNTETITYTSLKDFHEKNGVKKETFSINAVTGGSFVSTKGTTVNIPANAFKDTVGNFLTGTINFEFKDIYKKSDMVLSDMPTNSIYGVMISAGEFELLGTSSVKFVSTKTITINQPLTVPSTSNMAAYYVLPDTTNQTSWRWFGSSGAFPTSFGSLTYNSQSYLYTIFPNYFGAYTGTNSAHWYNSDDADAFYSLPQTTINVINPDNTLNPEVFMLFTTVNSAVRIYYTGNYSYQFAPIGFSVTIVAIAEKNGKIYSSFIPTTITANKTVTLNFNVTSTSDLINSLKTLD